MKYDIEKRVFIVKSVYKLPGGALKRSSTSKCVPICTDEAYFSIKPPLSHQNNRK